MSYCSRCGVQVEDGVKNCPLCLAPIQHFEPQIVPRVWKNPGEDKLIRNFPTPIDLKNRVYTFLTTALAMACLILWAVDFRDGGSLGWSWIPVVSLLGAFFYITSFFQLYRSFIRLTFGLMGSTAFLLGSLNFLMDSQWFFTLGLPITLGLQFIFTFSYFIIKRFQVKGYNIFGVVLGMIGLFLLLLDYLIHHYKGEGDLSWSVITSFCLFPFSLYFFYLHYGLHKVLDFTRTFHL